jgi:hypothetical protein
MVEHSLRLEENAQGRAARTRQQNRHPHTRRGPRAGSQPFSWFHTERRDEQARAGNGIDIGRGVTAIAIPAVVGLQPMYG